MTKRRHRKENNIEDVNLIPEGGNGLIYVGFPRERFMMPEFVDNRDAILMAITNLGRGCGYFNANGHRVDKNRDNIVDSFMADNRKPEWLLMLDTDMNHPTNIAEILVKHNVPIVGGLYFHRGQEHDPFIFRRVQDLPDRYGRMAPHWAPMRSLVYEFLSDAGLPNADGSFHVTNPPMNPLVECDAVATGALLVHRSVFERLPAPWFEYRTLAISEDLMFCKIAKDYGYKVYCDLSVISGHYILSPVGQAQFRTIYETISIRATQFSKEQAYTDLAEYFSIPLNEAKEFLDDVTNRPSKRWEELNPKTDEEVSKFYKDPITGKLYIAELMYWNMSDGFTRLRSNLRKIRNANVLELGSGIGTLACQMGIQMNNTFAYEPNEILRGFMDMRIKQMIETPGMECKEPTVIRKDDWWNQIEDGSIDYVMAFDVFEHIPYDELCKIIEHAANKLKSQGRLLYHNNFQQQDIFPMHFDYTDMWSDIVEKAGLIEVSPLEAIKK